MSGVGASDREQRMTEFYNRHYSATGSFREAVEGRMWRRYKLPKYIRQLRRFSGYQPGWSVLELGAGNGELSVHIREALPDVARYVASEYTQPGVDALRARGFEAYQDDACALTRYRDGEFDFVCAFDTMHHVRDADRMAAEMLRVARHRVFLIEANGLSLARRLGELAPAGRAAGEGSYYPWQYRRFFTGHGGRDVSIRPFLFALPWVPDFWIPAIGALSDLGEDIPLLRWQGSGVIITADPVR